MLKFKNVRRDTRDYDSSICCVVGCSKESEVIIDSKRFSSVPLPLCEKHWVKYCEIPFERNEHNECIKCEEARDKQKIQAQTQVPKEEASNASEETQVPTGCSDGGVEEK